MKVYYKFINIILFIYCIIIKIIYNIHNTHRNNYKNCKTVGKLNEISLFFNDKHYNMQSKHIIFRLIIELKIITMNYKL